MFVRTKDKIIKVDETGYIKEIDVCGKKCLFLFNKNYLYGREVVKQADNLNELFDEFIHDNRIIRFESRSKKYFYYLGDDFDFDVDKKMIEEGIYGAIWTSKGLIYVAKMNEKGELELL